MFKLIYQHLFYDCKPSEKQVGLILDFSPEIMYDIEQAVKHIPQPVLYLQVWALGIFIVVSVAQQDRASAS